jgi:hypothetical protein
MSGKYIPPALRNKKEPSLTSDDFPSLGISSQQSKTSFKPTRSFAVLATEWNEHEEEEKLRKEAQQSIQRHEAQRRAINDRNVFVYRPDAEYYNEDRPDDSVQPLCADDEWQVIQKKAQRELTTEELFEKKARMEEEEKRMEEDSVWKDGNLTDWDYRDRRAYS